MMDREQVAMLSDIDIMLGPHYVELGMGFCSPSDPEGVVHG